MSKKNISEKVLIVANFLPILGVLFWDWSLFNIMFLYWLESAIIGFYSILKIIKTDGIRSIFSVFNFLLLFIPFMAIHFLIIFGILTYPIFIGVSIKSFLAGNPELIHSFSIVLPALIVIVISHGISYYLNFIKKKEYLHIKRIENVGREFINRLMVMQFVLLFGILLIIIFKTSNLLIIPLIVLKIGVDLRAHQRQHRTDLEI